MDYDLSAEEKLIRNSARRFFSKEIDSDYIREMIGSEKGYKPETWKKMAELGWMGLIIPEEYEGLEMRFIDMAILLYEMGYAAFPGPFFEIEVLLIGGIEFQGPGKGLHGLIGPAHA